MPNTVDLNGLTIQSLPEILDEILAGLRQIYGPDINVDQNSPDGQLANLMALGKIDSLELAKQVYNSFDPDKAIGRALDRCCSYNGVTRQGATFTILQIEIHFAALVTLPGLNNSSSPFTVSDANGNRFMLIDSFTPLVVGEETREFRAENSGNVLTTSNTVTQIVTPTLGIESVNNPEPVPIQQGVNEETDFSIRIRRARSVGRSSKGYLISLYAELYAVANLTQAHVYENYTNAVDANGVNPHSILVVVLGGADADIANAIYLKHNAGCGLDGSTSVTVSQVDGRPLAVKFTRATSENLYIEFDIATVGGDPVDEDYLRAQLLERLSYTINQIADTTSIIVLIKAIIPNASVSAEGVSPDDATYTSTLSTSTIYKYFVLAADRIKINGSFG